MPQAPYDWDEEKADANISKHGVRFEAIYGFDWASALRSDDTRYDYGERRRVAIGKIGGRDHVVVYTVRGTTLRIISLRKANRRERR